MAARVASVWLVPDGLDGDRVDAAAARITGLSRSRIEELAEAGQVMVNSQTVSKSHRVRAGDLLEMEIGAVAVVEVVPQMVAGIGIVYDDADIVVVDKPAGVAAHPSLGWDGPSVVEHLAAAGFRISTSGVAERQGVVQRLDVGTTGLMVVAKSEPAYTALKRAFRSREVSKIYHTLVQGLPDPLVGTIDAPIGRHPGADYKMAVVGGGRHSVTHYEVLEAFRYVSLLEVHLETGRTHQIRVHMQAIRHPCVGDPTYGADPVLARRLGLERQWLHAVQLGFIHPRTGEAVEFRSEYPQDLVAALATVRRDS
ncbi:RluA family pseudouridine synthase [Propionicimonas sp.]|uniref:RluA family pseudouridine synthase n=1 Tax=Propionicimonas sp. TaxID=1955623 RepID=UPI0018150261|nr:RluA family pseudouridine synthase [Propionicimonas sp.]MBU3977632.1 RluA family pseudouridine synthase [Actinomycetota bacterium]MBA3021556.1 RluA family pseudouridine synthase [Propionicimonas sp.]MBU3987106.1 RluA family pseudouridine synthase [Actinomycetota bacterium]MBU4008927.1 RluA family pseudouridine synthase [Actinomycetota bacterium]MBU4065923.1 RluA family pseudouridine synthase [Actinomycetota bacterium]